MSAPSVDACGETVAWHVRLSDDRPARRYVVLAVAAAVGLGGTVVMGSVLLGALGFAMILGSTAEHWLGTSYRMGPDGLSARTGLSLVSMRWEDVRRLTVAGDVLRASPHREPGRLDAFRGVEIRLRPEVRDRAWALVRAKLDEDVRFVEQ